MAHKPINRICHTCGEAGVKETGKTRNRVMDQFVERLIGGTLGSAHRESSPEQLTG